MRVGAHVGKRGLNLVERKHPIDRKSQLSYLDLADTPPYDLVLLRIKRTPNVWVVATASASGKFYLHCMMPAGHGFVLDI